MGVEDMLFLIWLGLEQAADELAGPHDGDHQGDDDGDDRRRDQDFLDRLHLTPQSPTGFNLDQADCGVNGGLNGYAPR
jgi:hypothetical protein